MRYIKRMNKKLVRKLVLKKASDKSIIKGTEYAHNGSVQKMRIKGTELRANVRGTYPYRVRLEVVDGTIEYDCSCPYGADGACCKHCVAVEIGRASCRERV